MVAATHSIGLSALLAKVRTVAWAGDREIIWSVHVIYNVIVLTIIIDVTMFLYRFIGVRWTMPNSPIWRI